MKYIKTYYNRSYITTCGKKKNRADCVVEPTPLSTVYAP